MSLDKILPDYNKKNAINLVLVAMYGILSTGGTLIVNQIRTIGSPTWGGAAFFFLCLACYAGLVTLRTLLFEWRNGQNGKIEELVKAIVMATNPNISG